jgi:hypothetical protein
LVGSRRILCSCRIRCTGQPSAASTGTYFPNAIDLETAESIVLAGGTERTALDIRLRSAESPAIKGKIINMLPDSKNQTVGLSLVPLDPNVPFENVPPIVAHSMNRETGEFEIRGIRPGSYELVARSNTPRGVFR